MPLEIEGEVCFKLIPDQMSKLFSSKTLMLVLSNFLEVITKYKILSIAILLLHF